MALKKLFAQRLSSVSRITIPNCRVSSAPALNRSKLAPDPGDDGIFRRYLHRKSAATTSAAMPFIPTGEKLLEKLREMDIGRDRIKVDRLRPATEGNLTVKDAVKILKLSQLDLIKTTLRQIQKDRISYSEFLAICSRECSNVDQAMEFAKVLDQSGSVIVIGNTVYLRPEQVVKAIEGLIPDSPHSRNDPRMKQLEEMEKQKASIDKKAKSLVQRELWCGLGYIVAQTAIFMRLTFWELTWDVMEPICFYVTSMYFMGGYAFFLTTQKEPSFEGFFQSRFIAKQKRLMTARKFDIEKYNELKKACYPNSPQSAVTFSSSIMQ